MSVSTIQSPTFHAAWPVTCQPAFIDTVSEIAWNIFSCIAFPVGLCRLIYHCIAVFPGKLSGGETVHFQSPDGIHLSGTLFWGRERAKVILAAEGTSATLSQTTLNQLQATGATIMTVQCRGISSGFHERMKVPLDLYSAYEFLIHAQGAYKRPFDWGQSNTLSQVRVCVVCLEADQNVYIR